MLKFILDRIVRLVAVLAAITVASFLFMHAIPGDPVQIRLGEHASPEEIKHLTQSLGLDKPLYVQLGAYAGALLHGDLGRSIGDTQPVAQKLAQYFPATLELTLGAMLFAIAFGIPAGVFSAVRHRSWLDALTMSGVLLGVSIPVFWLGWMLVYSLAVVPSHFGLNLFPISGRISMSYFVPARTHLVVLDALLAGNGRAALDALWHLLLPAATLGTIPLAIVAKITRSGMLDVLASDYIRTARAKGLDDTAVVMKHALRNALIPIITVLGLQTGLLLGGAVLTESIFAWPGVGRLAFDAISNRDMPLINGCILLFATVFVVVNTGVDVLYALANPRIRYGS
ncbi:MAG: ABC transporter permease subunit [Candidatus Velthaea sp.]